MAQQAASIRLAHAPIEERIAHLEQVFGDIANPLARRQEGIALARETGSEDLADLILALEEQDSVH